MYSVNILMDVLYIVSFPAFQRSMSASRVPRRDTSMEELAADARGRDSALSLMDPEIMLTERRLELVWLSICV